MSAVLQCPSNIIPFPLNNDRLTDSPSDPAKKVQVMLVEDHASMRNVVRALIETHPGYEVCGEADTAEKARDVLGSSSPDIAVVDISLPSTSGIEVTRKLLADKPGLRVLILSMHSEALYAKHALRAGAVGYLMKHEAADKIHDALNAVLMGKTYVSDRVLAEIEGSV
jgi:DNA-binding NarL/FixJ family response regulator